ncbi:MAG: hypothetical protein KME52_18575 [Desmonostoc geniculatum HA4340-LM1]|jgi:hypothetical protein|nr:hypothetical protein [Desmonostoc geniculatum HA4340-LM1]
MTRQIYTVQQLQELKLGQIKTIALTLGVTPEGDKRETETWVNAIVAHQSSQVQKINSPKTEDDVTFTDIDGFYNFEGQVKNEVIAELSHDAFNDEKPWYVSVSGVEVYRSALYCEATDWVKHQYVADALPKHQQQQVQVLTTREERAATIEVLEQHGNEFVIHNCENDHYYVVRPNHVEPKERCECADCHYRSVKCKHQIAVENYLVQQSLEKLIAVTPSLEELLDKPFDELPREEWERLKDYEPADVSMELVAA